MMIPVEDLEKSKDETTAGSPLATTVPAVAAATNFNGNNAQDDQVEQSQTQVETAIASSDYPDSAPVADEIALKAKTAAVASRQAPTEIRPDTPSSFLSSLQGEEPDMQSVDTSLAPSLESDADSARWVRTSPFGNESLLDQLSSAQGLKVGLNHTLNHTVPPFDREAPAFEESKEGVAESLENVTDDESAKPTEGEAKSDESKTNDTMAVPDDNLSHPMEAPIESDSSIAQVTPAPVLDGDLIDLSPEPKQNDTGPTEMVQLEVETTLPEIPAEDTQTLAQVNHPEPIDKIEVVAPRQEETLSAFEQELQKAHDSSPGLQALQALPGYENVFIEIDSSTAESVDENSEPTPVTDQEAQRMIDEIYKMAEDADLEEEMLASISSETITSQALNRIVEEMRLAAESAKEAVEEKSLAKEAKKRTKKEKSKRRSSKQPIEPPQKTIVINKHMPMEHVVKHYTRDYIPKQYASSRSNTVSFVEEVIEYEFDGVNDDITDAGDSSTVTKSVTEDSVQRMIGELQRMSENSDTGNDSATSGSATITRDEMERMVAEIRLAAKQTASEPVKPKDLTENEAQQMVTDIKAAAESEDSETSKELTEQEVHRMIVEMRQAAEKADSEEAAEREMQRMVDEMKWAAEEQVEEEAEEQAYLERKRKQRRRKIERSRSRSKSPNRSRSKSHSRRKSRSRSHSRRRSSHSRRRSSSPWSDSSSSTSSSESSTDDNWSSGTSSGWSSRSESPTRERMRRASLKRRKSRARRRGSKSKSKSNSPQEQAIHNRFGYLTGLISKEDLQEIIDNEKRRREQRQLLELVSRSDLQGILDRERNRRSIEYEDIPIEKKTKKKRQSNRMSAKAFNSSKRRHIYEEDKPTMKEKVTKLMPNVFSSNRRKNKTRKEEDEMLSKMESQESSVTALDRTVRKPYSYLFYGMVCIGMTGLILAAVAVVSYMNQQKENVP
ncbi:unnamed protein product [Cylindrotheca closterium]|uniref:Uncharacterized protein n=1 Tax=Cylindrotheca closterium TaxID=2856 RepID=A0AAD2FWV8_9STRA|nr:unnamed protein product [Cylindrotheca closterium]